jgi:excisionase family DNA binding protein
MFSPSQPWFPPGQRGTLLVMEPFFLTIDQTAEQLQISTKTVRRMLLSGRLPGKRIGTRWRISAGALLTFMDARANAADIKAFVDGMTSARAVLAQNS